MMKENDNKPEFTELNDLASIQSGGKILFATDDFFAVAENMIADGEPVFVPDKYTEFGKWMDGWETRRKRIPGHDWCIVRLGSRGIIYGLDVDTAYFTGNFTPKYSIQAARLTPEDETLIPKRTTQMGSASSKEVLEQISKLKSNEWQEIVPLTLLLPGYEDTRHNYQIVKSNEPWTHLRVNMHPDGGIARLKVFGIAKPNLEDLIDKEIDLISMANGAVCQGFSNAHYGHPRNLIKSGRGVSMSDGWETARRLDRPAVIGVRKDGTLEAPGNEWAVFKLGRAGTINKINIDTCHFKGNYPDSVKIEGVHLKDFHWHSDISTDTQWNTILALKKLSADSEHWYECSREQIFSHVKITMAPDGGISRVRLLGCVSKEIARE